MYSSTYCVLRKNLNCNTCNLLVFLLFNNSPVYTKSSKQQKTCNELSFYSLDIWLVSMLNYTIFQHQIQLLFVTQIQPFPARSKFSASSRSNISSSDRSLGQPYAAKTASSSFLCASSSQVGRALYRFVSVRFFFQPLTTAAYRCAALIRFYLTTTRYAAR